MSKPIAVFFPTHCYFTSSSRLDGKEHKDFVLIDTLYVLVGQPLYVYYNRALELAVAQSHDILYLDTGLGSSATQVYLAAEIERLNSESMGIHARAISFTEFLSIGSMDCLEVMRSIYDMYNLEWHNDWTLWLTAYWNLYNSGATAHGYQFALTRPG